MNFDAIGTQAEVDQANTNVGVNHRLIDIFAQAGSPTSYAGVDHNFSNQYTSEAYWENVVGTVTTPYGDYTVLPGSTTTNVTNEIGTANAVRLGTQRGKSTPDVAATTTEVITFTGAQQGTYDTINLLFSGENTDAAVSGQVRKSAWVTVTANYSDGDVLVWTSPRAGFDTDLPYGDDRDNIAGGLPSPVGYITASGLLEQAYKDTFNQIAMGSIHLANGGGDPDRFSYGRDDAVEYYMYDIVGGIDVDETRTLEGLEVTVNNGPNLWSTGYPEGDEVNIYGITGDLIPEPATMGLLAIGGIALLRRKRK